MSKKRYKPEQIIGMLREAEVVLAQGETAAQVADTMTWALNPKALSLSWAG